MTLCHQHSKQLPRCLHPPPLRFHSLMELISSFAIKCCAAGFYRRVDVKPETPPEIDENPLLFSMHSNYCNHLALTKLKPHFAISSAGHGTVQVQNNVCTEHSHASVHAETPTGGLHLPSLFFSERYESESVQERTRKTHWQKPLPRQHF